MKSSHIDACVVYAQSNTSKKDVGSQTADITFRFSLFRFCSLSCLDAVFITVAVPVPRQCTVTCVSEIITDC